MSKKFGTLRATS